MKLQFKYQKFQADAAKAVADVFAGQPCQTAPLWDDREDGYRQMTLDGGGISAGWANAPIVPELSDEKILEQIRRIQSAHQMEPSRELEGRYNLTVEMETGVGKTYTYIKTMYELNQRYGWTKFIIVVPSIAIREGVYQALEATQEHFAEEYGKKIRFFIYHSGRLAQIDRFVTDSAIHVMIINAQAFNAKGKDARRIYMKLDEFQSRRPIDLIARTNPIMIIDEPQSVEGKQTRENLKQFHPLMTLRYSATHRADSIYNMVYRLDAMEAYNRRLVKKIAVKGITETGSTATEGYVYLQSINLSREAPTATIQFDYRGVSGIRKKTRTVGIGFDLYAHSGDRGGLEEYRDGFVVRFIDGRDDSIEFLNGIRLCAGDVIGKVSEDQLRRIQIRETILSHLERERQLFGKGIKVLSLFFIDEVAHYKVYDEDGEAGNGLFARMFEEEYEEIVRIMQYRPGEEGYRKYLEAIPAMSAHAGYFSIDRKGGRERFVNSRIHDRKAKLSDDVSAYDLIMRDKERLLDLDPKRSPVRFLFSHSALREGWDNPNVFQICTLKQGGSEVRKRQEVGRGLRLCVDQEGRRMDESVLGEEVHQVNVLTVIASESYDSFARGLQEELAEAVAGRPGPTSDSWECMRPENARGNNIELQLDPEKLSCGPFQDLWSRISQKTAYVVDFDPDRLVERSIRALDERLMVPKIYYQVESGQLEQIDSREALQAGLSMKREASVNYGTRTRIPVSQGVRYDLVGKLVEETGLTRKDMIRILTGIQKPVFDQFRDNPEEFILKAAALINEQKAAAIIEHIAYEVLDERYGPEVFTDARIRGKLGVNAIKTKKHLYDHVVYDSARERVFAEQLEASGEVAAYVKLPNGFYIPTPVGRYHPDWAIAFREGTVEHPFFLAETKGSLDSMQLRLMEEAKIHCAREHFRAVDPSGGVVYEVVDSYETLMQRAGVK